MLVDLAWDANEDADLAGYRVYQGRSPGLYSGFTTTATEVIDAQLTVADGANVYFAISAFDINGNESPLSDEITTINRYAKFRL